MPENLLIVESPAKAKTIEKYLGANFRVLSSVGHIRTDTKVDPEDNFKVTYEIDEDHKKIVSELKKAAKAAKTIWLATDEDREGEAISWHLKEVLNLPNHTHRITFHEITKSALENAIKSPRTINLNMVYSQQARQTLDMLVGYDLSGVVRRKVPGAISAGRVQSPALRLIVEKEAEIDHFSANSSYKTLAEFSNFQATLEKTRQPKTKDQAKSLLSSLKNIPFVISDIKQTAGTKQPPTPLTTAALQIEASSKLGFSAKTTMRAAQGLYQAGHISYHRTDSLNLSNQALASIANYITKNYGEKYLHTRHFKTKSASAQEAHEAIRPTNINTLTAGANDYEKKLYHLIHSRTLATQMSPANIDKTTIKLYPLNQEKLIFTTKGEILKFDGFLKVYGKSKDTVLPTLTPNQQITPEKIIATEDFTNPPARYTEGSLVKKLEELGIGRPSTYASIISALQTRKYVIKGESEGTPKNITQLTLNNKDNNPHPTEDSLTIKTGANKGKLLPTPIGELISSFLQEHFANIVDYNFTADIEQKLDQIAEQKLEKVAMLKSFYTPFRELVYQSGSAPRHNSATLLGQDPKTGKNIYAKIGRNGGFIQLGENEKDSGEKPRFAPLPKNSTVKTINLAQALSQLELPSLPRTLGYAKDNTELIAASGPFGPYLKAGKYNLPIKDYDPYTIDLATAKTLYQAKLDSIIADWDDIMIINGVYGPYIKGPGRFNNIKIPKDKDPKTITKAEAIELLASKKSAKSNSKSASKTKKSNKSSTKSKKSKTTKKSTKSAKIKAKTAKSTTKKSTRRSPRRKSVK